MASALSHARQPHVLQRVCVLVVSPHAHSEDPDHHCFHTDRMRAWIYDDLEGDQRLPHSSGDSASVPLETLEQLGLVPRAGIDMDEVEVIAKERGYKNRDEINVSKAGLGDVYEEKLKGFFREHMHEDEEIRYIKEGAGYFDVRDSSDSRWIRIEVTPKDLIVLPPGIYHRFTLDSSNYVKALRLFQDEPKWVPHDRSASTDENPYRKRYVETFDVRA